MGNENRDITPVIFKFGVAIALSFGGVLYSLIINKRLKASISPDDTRTRSDCNEQMNSRSNHLRFDPLAKDKHEELHYSNNTEFVRANNESPKEYSCAEKDTHEQELKSLRNTVKNLKERESNLEIKLLEFYGLKEQETVVMELQNHVKLNNMEAKLFELKIESLQADNKRLEAQMADNKKLVTELDDARAKIKMLKKKLKSEGEENKKQILEFHQRVQKMQEDENKYARIDSQVELELQKIKGLEVEVAELRKSNHDLQLEKEDLDHRLDCVQIMATSVLEDAEVSTLILLFDTFI
ncbi:protein CHUP1, chloroplastic-like [Bidens hawaiensis]|uniref:protein CHUP1, chloroplastic-like n=1 Tax=Bidens hawaiensis TaxID=980011 RepID=UPI00404A414E